MFSFVVKLKNGRSVQLDMPAQEGADALMEVLADSGAEYTVRGPKWYGGSFKWTPEAEALLRKLTRGKRKRPQGLRFGPVN